MLLFSPSWAAPPPGGAKEKAPRHLPGTASNVEATSLRAQHVRSVIGSFFTRQKTCTLVYGLVKVPHNTSAPNKDGMMMSGHKRVCHPSLPFLSASHTGGRPRMNYRPRLMHKPDLPEPSILRYRFLYINQATSFSHSLPELQKTLPVHPTAQKSPHNSPTQGLHEPAVHPDPLQQHHPVTSCTGSSFSGSTTKTAFSTALSGIGLSVAPIGK